ncbi:hypothetical protein [Paracoccus mutanolyticus]|uniref:hypothetical protein n=1 Tax=Paracoccus mutanolyticus TaxID=1499308 RepID=UPI00167356EF|nr:hypothetical protein [Paracoccus mutanolyticus]
MQKDTKHWLRVFAEQDVPAAPVFSLDEFLQDGQVAHNRIFGMRSRLACRPTTRCGVGGTAIMIHGGSTCFHFGCRIAHRNLRVFTNSMPLAAYLSEYGTCLLTVGR